MNTLLQIILTAATSFIVTYTAIPSIIKVARIKHLFDEPDDRKHHTDSTPTLGGMAIFAGFIFSTTFWSNQNQITELQYIISALLIMFFMGVKDDIVNLVAYKKFIAQLLAALIVTIWGGIHLSSFYGLFGIYTIPDFISIPFSIFIIIAITNSINLIDGIDTLAASIGLLCMSILGTWFYLTENIHYAILAFSMLGSLLGFYKFNFSPARIFMGDTGSLVLGITCSILIIKFIELNRIYVGDPAYMIKSVPAVAISILLIPIFDTVRVFGLRVLKGRSPFTPDRQHIHHILIDLGYNHIRATLILITFNLIIIILNYIFMHFTGELLVLSNFVMMLLFTSFFSRKRNRHKISLRNAKST
jgi:UDP-GlcNAc:undecaprenyl-phosphate GlcNAc-1-phosphate transferase